MALTIVSSYGGGTSNSYVSYTVAASIVEMSLDQTPWTDASTTTRYAALVQATRMIDAKCWKGDKYYYDQILEFPRSIDGITFREESTPDNVTQGIEFAQQKVKVMNATVAQAIYLLRVSTDLTKRSDLRAQGVTQFSLGKFSESYGDSGNSGSGNKRNALCDETLGYLGEYKGMPKLYRR